MMSFEKSEHKVIDMSTRSLFVAGACLCFPVTAATAGVISLGSLHHPVVEPFEKIIGGDAVLTTVQFDQAF